MTPSEAEDAPKHSHVGGRDLDGKALRSWLPNCGPCLRGRMTILGISCGFVRRTKRAANGANPA